MHFLNSHPCTSKKKSRKRHISLISNKMCIECIHTKKYFFLFNRRGCKRSSTTQTKLKHNKYIYKHSRQWIITTTTGKRRWMRRKHNIHSYRHIYIDTNKKLTFFYNLYVWYMIYAVCCVWFWKKNTAKKLGRNAWSMISKNYFIIIFFRMRICTHVDIILTINTVYLKSKLQIIVIKTADYLLSGNIAIYKASRIFRGQLRIHIEDLIPKIRRLECKNPWKLLIFEPLSQYRS